MSAAVSFTRFDRRVSGTSSVERPDLPDVEAIYTTLSLAHFFPSGLAAELNIPIGQVFRKPGPAAPATETAARSAGFGDLDVGLRYALSRLWAPGPVSLTATFGLLLPTGSPNKLGDVSTTDTPAVISIGTGAYGLRGGLHLTWLAADMLAITAGVDGRGPLSASPEQDGNSITFGPSVGYRAGAVWLAANWFTLSLDLSGRVSGHGDSSENGELVNSGGHRLAVELSAAFTVTDGPSFFLGGRVPIFEDLNGTQVAETFGIWAGVAYTWASDASDKEDAHDHGEGEGEGDAHDHGKAHDHGDAHDDHGDARDDHGDAHEHPPAGAGDVRDVATGGDSFVLNDALAPGKITVIDFWASWCAPCKVIDAGLKRLAAAHPNDLAVRKAEAPDLNDDIVDAHLGGDLRLPVVWVYDRAGKRIDTLKAVSAEEVLRRVEARLTP